MKRMIGFLMMVVGVVGCGGDKDSPTGPLLVCKQFADEYWDVLSYLAWDSSSISSRSSKTHHLPCQSFIEDDSKEFSDCPDQQQYYELIGKYDQFISGWTDVNDLAGNAVEVSQIDSVEHYHSASRLLYEECRDGNIAAIE